MPDDDVLLAEVRAAVAALGDALAVGEARRLAAVRAAFDAGMDRTHIADAAGMTRVGVYKLLARAPTR